MIFASLLVIFFNGRFHGSANVFAVVFEVFLYILGLIKLKITE